MGRDHQDGRDVPRGRAKDTAADDTRRGNQHQKQNRLRSPRLKAAKAAGDRRLRFHGSRGVQIVGETSVPRLPWQRRDTAGGLPCCAGRAPLEPQATTRGKHHGKCFMEERYVRKVLPRHTCEPPSQRESATAARVRLTVQQRHQKHDGPACHLRTPASPSGS